jgi:uncharacterized protein
MEGRGMSDSSGVAQLVIGRVRHRRLRPASHELAYPCWFVLLPLRRLRAGLPMPLARNRRAWASFFDADHGAGGTDCLAWIESLLAQHGHTAVDGEIWLQTMPRVFGRVFNPVSFWYCHAADGRLSAIVAEVNNTFGERHCYLLDGAELAWGRELRARKQFHVSPFCRVSGSYRFRFMRRTLDAAGRGPVVARIELDDEQGPVLSTSVSGEGQVMTASALRSAMWRMPLAVLGIAWRIHWHALQLWVKRVPWFPHRPHTAPTVTR